MALYPFSISNSNTTGYNPKVVKYRRYGIISVKKIQLKVFPLNSNGNVTLSSHFFIMSLCKIFNPVNSNIFIQSPPFFYQYRFPYITFVKNFSAKCISLIFQSLSPRLNILLYQHSMETYLLFSEQRKNVRKPLKIKAFLVF